MENITSYIPVNFQDLCSELKFKTSFSAEIIRELLLPDQLTRLHENAARVLEDMVQEYEFCCKRPLFDNVMRTSISHSAADPKSIDIPTKQNRR